MQRSLILYSTVDGHTKLISKRIAEILSQTGVADCYAVAEYDAQNLSEYDLVVIGGSIRYGKHRPDLYKFIQKHKLELDAVDNALFSVNAVARKSEKNSPDTNPYLKKFLNEITWEPKRLAVFAGKIDYKKYKFFDKLMIRFIMWLTKGPTNTAASYDFTDWAKVEDFARRLLVK